MPGTYGPTSRRVHRTRVLGSCYVCGKMLFGRMVYELAELTDRLSKANVAVRYGEGVRHSRCRRALPGFGEILAP